MTEDDLYYTMALQRVEGIGDVLFKKIMTHFESPEAVFRAKTSDLARIDGIGASIIKNLKDKAVFSKVSQEMKFVKEQNLTVIHYQSAKYPERLKQCYDSPVLLFSSGNVNLQSQKMISIVGTRQITSYGMDFCKKFISDLQPLNPVIVSGFAYGVDIVAHQEAMEMGLQTIGVLAHGFSQIYPKTHKKYMAKMEQNGGFLTEFWSYTNPDKENFVRRNRIVAGMCEATVVIESAEKGGSLITANMANDYNRDVFAVPGRVTDKYSIGCNNLIKEQKANVLTSAADLVYALNWDLKPKQNAIQKQLFVEMNADEQLIYDYLQKGGKQVLDELSIGCQFPIFKLSGMLIQMELKGLIRPLPGKLFEAI